MMAFAICAIDEMPSSNTATDSYEYDAFGNSVTVSGSTPNEMLYRGEQFDSDLGLYYLRARYYNPITGRFMSRDPNEGNPYDPRTLHKYLYAGGDPVNLLDPTGRAEEEQYEAGTLESLWHAEEVSAKFTKDLFLCFVGLAAAT